MRKNHALLLLLSLGWIFNYAHRMAIPPLIPIIKSELGINNAQAGLLMTSLLLPYALIQVPAGYMGDRIGRKRMVIVSILGYSIASSFMVLAHKYWHMLGIRALYGLFAGLYYAPATALISELYEEKKGSALGVFMVGPPIGSGIAPLIVIPIALALEWRYAFLVLSIMSSIIGLALIFLIKGEVHEVENPHFSIPGHVIMLSVMNFITLGAFFGMLTFLPDFFVHSGRSLKEASFYFSLLSILGIFGSLAGGAVYDKLKKGSIVLTLSVNALLSFLLARTALPLIVPILGVFFYSVGPIVTAYTSELATDKNRGSVMGFVNMMGFFGATAGPYILGLLIDNMGYGRAFYAIPIMYAVSVGIILLEKNKVG